eukprot:TRINITY_DN12023_c0_g1_i1.p1 TRINITY_DN12023_c0_g1~~TRINITY_DN12023_c0_g1_i1.p1  ORF type:complete len:531 (+),score=80.62 TRINITY_DN12023_c0_g1_i1:84-1676(+)
MAEKKGWGTYLAASAINSIEQVAIWMSPKSKKNMFLENNYAPVDESGPWPDLPVIGELPVAINGEFVRNGPNPRFPPIRNYHLFDGDGMLHGVRIKDGKATLVSRLVKTSRLQQETAYKRSVFIKLGDLAGFYALVALLLDYLRHLFGIISDENGAGTGNTALVYHDGRLLALHEGDHPYAIRVLQDGEMETLGRFSYGGQLNHNFTAHPKVDANTGEMFFFGYDAARKGKTPYIDYRRVTANGEISAPVKISLRKPIMMHDFAVTERYAVFMDLPVVFTPQDAVTLGSPFKFDKTMPSRFGILPRDAQNETNIRWFELPPCGIFHTANAWEDGDEVVLHACRFSEIDLTMFVEKKKDRDMPVMVEYRFNMVTGKAAEKQLIDFFTDFPRINDNLIGRKQRYAYAAHFTRDMEGIQGIVKVDLWGQPKLGLGQPEPGTGVVAGYFAHGRGRTGSEAVFVPKEGGGLAEDDGYLLSFVYDESTNKSEMVVTDAKTMSATPVAVVKLPVRVPYGFHGLFVSEDQLRQQKKSF